MGDMSVNGASNVNATYATDATKKTENTPKTEELKKEETVAAVYEKSSEAGKKPTYSIQKMSAEDRAALVEKMKLDMVNQKNQLSSIVSQMLSKQGNVSNLSQMFSPENLKNVTAEDIAKAKQDISEDGYWGVKQTSQRLFDFASALAGDDVEKMKEMQAAMEKGFKKATKAWGGKLPDICQETINEANKMFDEYYASKKSVES
ncbi:MAG: hypothetical protein MJ105_07245 [Lachnospiraceae bacterium]|nr:hypothetical protein [Lachnospiraceae bacterium]